MRSVRVVREFDLFGMEICGTCLEPEGEISLRKGFFVTAVLKCENALCYGG